MSVLASDQFLDRGRLKKVNGKELNLAKGELSQVTWLHASETRIAVAFGDDIVFTCHRRKMFVVFLLVSQMASEKYEAKLQSHHRFLRIGQCV